MANKVAFVGSF